VPITVTGRGGWTRVLIAAAVPTSMCVVLWLFISYGVQSRLFDSMGQHLSCWNGKIGCEDLILLVGQPVLFVLAISVMLLVGPLLRLAGLRAVGPIVVGGPLIALILGRVYQLYLLDRAPLTLLAASLGIAGSYAAAAVLTMPQLRRFLRTGLAVLRDRLAGDQP